MNVRELKQLDATLDDAGPHVTIPAPILRRLIAVAVAAINHVDERGAYRTTLGQAVEKLQSGGGH